MPSLETCAVGDGGPEVTGRVDVCVVDIEFVEVAVVTREALRVSLLKTCTAAVHVWTPGTGQAPKEKDGGQEGGLHRGNAGKGGGGWECGEGGDGNREDGEEGVYITDEEEWKVGIRINISLGVNISLGIADPSFGPGMS